MHAPSDPPGTPEGDVNLSSARSEWQRGHLGPAGRDLLARDEEVFLRQSLSTPCLNALVGAEGSWLIDADGRRYLDFHGNSVHQVGHGHPAVIEAITRQMQSLPFCPRRYANEPAAQLGERLAAKASATPHKVLLAPGGAEAVGIAVKLARIATGRFKTVSFWDSFHGATLDAASVGGEALFRANIGPLMPGGIHVPPPDPIRCPLGCGGTCSQACASYLEYVLEKEGDVAAVIAEPMRATTAVPPEPGFWKRVREACDRHGTLLIFDEIPTGLGRTGRFFASEWTDVEPDIWVLGKGLGGGIFPLAAVLAHADLDVGADRALGHYTHEKSPVGAAAALASLDVIESEGLVARSLRLGTSFRDRLSEALVEHPGVREVRGRGLLIGIEMKSAAVAEAVMYEGLSNGLSFKTSSGTVLTLTPPLNIAESDLERAMQILLEALGKFI